MERTSQFTHYSKQNLLHYKFVFTMMMQKYVTHSVQVEESTNQVNDKIYINAYRYRLLQHINYTNVTYVLTAMFYYMLGNVNPIKRSKLKGIQLLALCKHTLIKKYGINEIIKPIVEDIKLLVCYVCSYGKLNSLLS